MIVGARIDFRLIHGQVANLWSNARQVSRFMVVDDEVSQDATQKQVLRMACPATVKLSVLPVDKMCIRDRCLVTTNFELFIRQVSLWQWERANNLCTISSSIC